MAITDIPSKFVESSAGLVETKIQTAQQLTAILYSSKNQSPSEKEVYETFLRYYGLLKDLPPHNIIETIPLKKNVLYSYGLIVLGIVFSFFFLIYYFR